MPNYTTRLSAAATMSSSITVLLQSAAMQLAPTSETPQLDAEVLLCFCLQKQRSYLRAWPDHCPAQADVECFLDLIERRRQGLPIAYLTQTKEFWSREFLVTDAVLIPRPDTELLVELALERLPKQQPGKLLDLGTGSGIIALSLAAERPESVVIAADINPKALAIAKQNASRLGVENARFLESDWFENIVDYGFDIVVSNPPYIAAGDPHLRLGDLRFEPQSALIGGVDGLRDIRTIAEQAGQRLKPGGHLLVEHGYDQAEAVRQLFQHHGYRNIRNHADLAGNPRVTSGIRNFT